MIRKVRDGVTVDTTSERSVSFVHFADLIGHPKVRVRVLGRRGQECLIWDAPESLVVELDALGRVARSFNLGLQPLTVLRHRSYF